MVIVLRNNEEFGVTSAAGVLGGGLEIKCAPEVYEMMAPFLTRANISSIGVKLNSEDESPCGVYNGISSASCSVDDISLPTCYTITFNPAQTDSEIAEQVQNNTVDIEDMSTVLADILYGGE